MQIYLYALEHMLDMTSGGWLLWANTHDSRNV